MYYEGCTIYEIRAYRKLESETFNFGEGEMKIEGWYGSEDAYYEMCLPEECGEYNYKENRSNKKYKPRLNRYTRKQINKKKLEWMRDNLYWYSVIEKDGYLLRYYRSKRGAGKILKKISNKKVRKYNKDLAKGSNYKKVFDYWNTLW